MLDPVNSSPNLADLSPCAGMRILDFTTNIAGPMATMVLAALGADVIKVEPPAGDDARWRGPFVGDESLTFHWANAGKRSLVADLKAEEGRRVVAQLLPACDVLVQSFRPGVMDRLGLGEDHIRQLAPDILICDISAFGADTPGAPSAGYDSIVQAFCGMMAMNGHDDEPPVRTAASVIDICSGQWAALAILAAHAGGHRGHRPRHIDITLFDTAMALLADHAAEAVRTRYRPPRHGSGRPSVAPDGAYRTSDGHVFISAGTDLLWTRLAETIGRLDLLEDPRFATNRARVQHHDDLRRALELTLSDSSTATWITQLRSADIPASPVNHLDEVVRGEMVRARRTFATTGTTPVVRIPLLYDDRVVHARKPAPTLGEHTADDISWEALSDTHRRPRPPAEPATVPQPSHRDGRD
jgi:crotonobetainyl-CoA:carnitine CoA-transferase CaiB-like acyl-CoA transferase